MRSREYDFLCGVFTRNELPARCCDAASTCVEESARAQPPWRVSACALQAHARRGVQQLGRKGFRPHRTLCIRLNKRPDGSHTRTANLFIVLQYLHTALHTQAQTELRPEATTTKVRARRTRSCGRASRQPRVRLACRRCVASWPTVARASPRRTTSPGICGTANRQGTGAKGRGARTKNE